jgi:sec-independent protein translocase protein TatA
MFKTANLLLLLLAACQAFAPLSVSSRGQQIGFRTAPTTSSPIHPSDGYYAPPALQRQRKSVAGVQLRGLFGLGAPEIAVILVAAAFLLGPQKLAELGKDAGKIAGELKEVPKEFQKGLEEGEQEAKKMKESMLAEKKDAE